MFSFLSDPISLIAITIASFAGFKLWNSFGDSTFAPPVQPQIQVPEPQAEAVNEPVPQAAPVLTEPVWKGYAEEGSSIAQVLESLHKNDASFTAREFMGYAKNQFEFISTAFAEGDVTKLKANLEPEILKLFETAIADQKSKGLSASFKLVGINAAKISDASLENNRAELTVALKAEVITATQDGDGKVKSGSLEKVSHLTEEWTFARELNVKNSTWRLSAT